MLYIEAERPIPAEIRSLFNQRNKRKRFSRWSEPLGLIAISVGFVLIGVTMWDKSYFLPLGSLAASVLYTPYTILLDLNRRGSQIIEDRLTQTIHQINQDSI